MKIRKIFRLVQTMRNSSFSKNKWSKCLIYFNILSNIVIAFASILFLITIQNAYRLQKSYYHRNFRPYIYTDSIFMSMGNSAIGNPVNFFFRLRNSGSLPGTNVILSMNLSDRTYHQIFNEPINENLEIAAIYPDQKIIFNRSIYQINFKDLEKYPYIYVTVNYKGYDDEDYYYRKIMYLRKIDLIEDRRLIARAEAVSDEWN